MGCGFTAPADFKRIDAIEVINGGITSGPMSGVAFWEARLNGGQRLIAVGGSDNHDATLAPGKAASVGRPTTVVHAENLSQDAVLAGLRAGRVFVDVQGTLDRLLDVKLAARLLTVRVVHASGGRLTLTGPAAAGLSHVALLGDDETVTLEVPANRTGWLRVDVRGPDGALWLMGNPVHLAPSKPQ